MVVPPAEAPPELLHGFFVRAAERWPDLDAVDAPPGHDRPDRERCNYADLRARAATIAAAIGPREGPDAIVALLLPRGDARLYAAELGVLALGAAYVAAEPSFPDAHLGFLLDDARVVAVLTDAAGVRRLAALRPSLRAIDVAALPFARGATLPPPPPWLLPTALAYVVYTSGTTGRPKGVAVEHRSAVALVAGDLAEFRLGPGDRIAQGSSPAYDSSVEEVWLAFAAGGTVVPLDEHVARLGPDLAPWLRRERITVLCPPPTLLRAMGDVEPARDLPDLRLVYAGGEALPQALADRWARGPRFVNGYGPTECTVTVVRAEVRPGEPVAIGRPVPGSTAHVLDERLEPVGPGEPGELCIGGASLARGYLHRPELTAERFVEHPHLGRIYRTGDRVRLQPDGALYYEGRLDAQVKVRGHRIELQEIENRLAGRFGVREAACAVQSEQLVGFFVAADGAAPDPAAILGRLRQELPAHMVPARLVGIDRLPTTVGGKLDRRALPALAAGAAPTAVAGPLPADPVEAAIAAAFAAELRLPTVAGDADFFDLGGDSVRAAGVVSRLRSAPATAGLAVRDVYDVRTVRALAALARQRAPAAARRRLPEGRRWPRTVTSLQGLWLAAEFALEAWLVWWAAVAVVPWSWQHLPAVVSFALLPPAWFALRLAGAPFAIGLVYLGKRLLVGRYTERCEPAYGGFHLRHWTVARLARLVPWELLQGTELQLTALRALGARIGERVQLHRGVDLRHGGWDLLDLGDDAAVGQDGALGVCELVDGHLRFGPVRMGRGATLATRASLCAGTGLGDGASLGPLAHLPAGASAAAGERWEGVPARPVGTAPPPRRPTGRGLGRWTHTALVLGLRLLGATVTSLPAAVCAGLAVDAELDLAVGALGWVLACCAIVFAVPCQVLAAGLLLRWGPRVPLGAFPVRSVQHVAIQLRAQVVEAAGIWLSGTMFWPAWLRLAGARIGRRAEVSTILDVLPEHLSIGDDCFFADGIYLGGPEVAAGVVRVAEVSIGDRTFLGNHAVIPAGSVLAPDLLLGVCTVAEPAKMTRGTAWFGNPVFPLPRREVVHADRRWTFEPGVLQKVDRAFWELLRAALPLVPCALGVWWWGLVVGAEQLPFAAGLFRVAVASLAVAAVAPALVLAAKWFLLGRVRPGQHGLWSCWCSRWDFLYVLWGFVGRPVLDRFTGTLWLHWFLRAVGVRVGRLVVLGPGFAQVVDPDMLEFGDGATIDTMFQAHSFEDRVLKIAPVRIGAGATLGHASVVLYGADLGDGCAVAPHGVVMKNERLAAGVAYDGAPSRPAADPAGDGGPRGVMGG